MKKSFIWAILAFSIGIVVSLGYNAYQNDAWPFGKNAPQGAQTTIVADIQSYMNPSFANATDFVAYANEVCVERQIDSVLSTIPVESIAQIADVAIRKYGSVDRRLFWKEYIANYDNVYKYLDKNSPPLSDPTALPSQSANQSAPVSPSTAIRNDTIVNATIVNQGTTTVTPPGNE